MLGGLNIFNKITDKITDMLTVKETDNQFCYIVKSLINRYDTHNVAQTAGQFAFFSLLSIFPFIIFINSLIGNLNLSGAIVTELLTEVFPVQIADIIGTYIDYITELGSGVGVISVGVIVALFSASKSVRSLSITINLALGIKEKRFFLSRIIMSVILTFFLGIVIILCLVAVTVGRDWIYRIILLIDMPVSWITGISIGKWLIVFTAFFIMLALVYWVIPIRRVKFRSVFPGAFLTIAANFVVTYGYSVYVEYFSSFSILYGTMGVVLLLALWLYLMGIFIIMGAELNGVLSEKNIFTLRKRKLTKTLD